MNTRSYRFIFSMVVMIVLLVGAFWQPQRTWAGTIVVNTPADELDGSPGNGHCSLREAITNANLNNGAQADCAPGTGDDIITLPADVYTLEGDPNENGNESGDLDIQGTLTINGVNSKTTIIQAGTTSPVNDTCEDCVDRVLDIQPAAVVEINHVTIRYGRSPDGVDGVFFGNGSAGGGIQNKGNLTLNHCDVYSNRSGNGVYDLSTSTAGNGGPGGGINNEGTLQLVDSSVSSNRSGNGAHSIDPAIKGGAGGIGGGINVNPNAIMVANNSGIWYNSTGNGGYGCDSSDTDAGDGGNGGNGGGISNYGMTTILTSNLQENKTGNGARGGSVTSGSGTGGGGGNGGDGGAIFNEEFTTSELTLVDTTLRDNLTGLGARGGTGSVSGENGKRGDGGGILIKNGSVELSGCTLSGNLAYDGGGILNYRELTITNSTISQNTAAQYGGGIYNTSVDAIAALVFVTVAQNTAEDGGGITSDEPLTITNSILANNSDDGLDHPDCYGNFTSGDYNLVGILDSPGCLFTPLANDQYGSTSSPLDPSLESLADNGGPTWTQALGAGSVAADQIPQGVNGCVTEVAVDQRGHTRLAPCDVGAYEIADGFLFMPLVLR